MCLKLNFSYNKNEYQNKGTYYNRKNLLPWDLALSEKGIYIRKTYIAPSTTKVAGSGGLAGEIIFRDELVKKHEEIDVENPSLFFTW